MQCEHVGNEPSFAVEIHLDIVLHNRVVGEIYHRGELGEAFLVFLWCGGVGVAEIHTWHYVILQIEVLFKQACLSLETLRSYDVVVRY